MNIDEIIATLSEWRKHSPDDPRYPNNMRSWYVPELLDHIKKIGVWEKLQRTRAKDHDTSPRPHEVIHNNEEYKDNLRHHTAQWMHNAMGLGGAWAATDFWIFACNIYRAIKSGELDRYMRDKYV